MLMSFWGRFGVVLVVVLGSFASFCVFLCRFASFCIVLLCFPVVWRGGHFWSSFGHSVGDLRSFVVNW